MLKLIGRLVGRRTPLLTATEDAEIAFVSCSEFSSMVASTSVSTLIGERLPKKLLSSSLSSSVSSSVSKSRFSSLVAVARPASCNSFNVLSFGSSWLLRSLVRNRVVLRVLRIPESVRNPIIASGCVSSLKLASSFCIFVPSFLCGFLPLAETRSLEVLKLAGDSERVGGEL